MNQLVLLAEEMTYSERASMAGTVTLVGMLIVFSVLALLMAALYIFQLVMYTIPQKKKAAAEAMAAAPAPAEEAPAEESAEDDLALIAVITAAVAAFQDAEGATGGFRVVSLKRKSGRTSWDGNCGIE